MTTQTPLKKRWYKQLYVWVLFAIVVGIVLGWLSPSTGEAMEPIGTTFVTAMKMLIGPCLLYTSPSPRDGLLSRMPSSA